MPAAARAYNESYIALPGEPVESVKTSSPAGTRRPPPWLEDSDMTSPGTAHASPLKYDSPSVASQPHPHRRHFRQRVLAENPWMTDLAASPLGVLGDTSVTVHFGEAPFLFIPPRTLREFGELLIITGDAGVHIGTLHRDGEDRSVLTGIKGRHNDCLILFRHAYGTVTCEFGVDVIAADAHLGFLRNGDFAELQTFSYPVPRERRSQGDAGFWSTLAYSATQLNELQGIVWRGGTLCIERITLEP
jgi:hypothetical protein